VLRTRVPMRHVGFAALFFISGVFAAKTIYGQAAGEARLDRQQPQPKPAFEVATIKPMNPNVSEQIGFACYPGGKVTIGRASLKILVGMAFNVQSFQVAGGADWTGSAGYNVVAWPPDTSESRTAQQPLVKATPTEEQREMLKSLLEDRFGLKVHREYRRGSVYILSKGRKTLMLQEPKYKDADPRAALGPNGVALGQNVSMKFLANTWGPWLERPVLDQTGLTGSYDFKLAPDDPANQDIVAATIGAIDRLGLKLTAGKGPIETIVIDSAHEPTPN
jgi:uncharacterized protein (TIGR03435 family)